MNKAFVFLISCGLFLAGCTAISQPTPTSIPTATVAPTATIAPTATPMPVQPGDSARKLTVDGVARSYLLHIPPGLNNQRPVPVVFVFSGFRQPAVTLPFTTGFNPIADQAGFLVIYPDGIGLSWNAGICCGDAVTKNIDETVFARQILADLGTIVSIDPKRIYASGLSNGAGMVYRLACEMPDTFAAIGPVAGVLMVSPCEPKQPISVIHIHGLKDDVAPFNGGGTTVAGGFMSVAKSIAPWVERDGCNATAQVEKQGDIIEHTHYVSCHDGTSVELYTLSTAGHIWPTVYIWPASQTIWDFFAAHPKQ